MPIIEQFFIKLTKAAQPPEMFHKKGVHKNSTIFTEQESPVLKSRLGKVEINAAQMFSCEYCKIFSNNCFEEHLHMATSENYKNIFLGKATSGTMIIIKIWVVKDKGQRLAVIDC